MILQLLGSVARLFTTAVLVKDWLVFGGYVVSAVFSGVLVGQCFWYGGRERRAAGAARAV